MADTSLRAMRWGHWTELNWNCDWLVFCLYHHGQQHGQVFSAVNLQYKSYNNVDVLTVYSCFYCIFLSFFFANIINGAHRHNCLYCWFAHDNIIDTITWWSRAKAFSIQIPWNRVLLYWQLQNCFVIQYDFQQTVSLGIAKCMPWFHEFLDNILNIWINLKPFDCCLFWKEYPIVFSHSEIQDKVGKLGVSVAMLFHLF